MTNAVPSNKTVREDAPLVYDLTTDEYRPVTQAEVDELLRIKAAYGNLRLMSQSVLSQSQQIAAGKPHKDADRDLDAYMQAEDLRQELDGPWRPYGPSYAERVEKELVRRTQAKFDTSGAYLNQYDAEPPTD